MDCWRLHNACGRFRPVFRHPFPFGAKSWRSFSREPSAFIGLLVADQFTTTIYEASVAQRRRRKSKIVHDKRPG